MGMISRVSKAFLLSLLFATSALAHKVTLHWLPSPTPGVSYHVFRGAASNGETQLTTTAIAQNCTNSTDCTFEDDAVQAGQTYFYYVEAYNGLYSTPSNEIQVTVPVTPVQGLILIQTQ